LGKNSGIDMPEHGLLIAEDHGEELQHGASTDPERPRGEPEQESDQDQADAEGLVGPLPPIGEEPRHEESEGHDTVETADDIPVEVGSKQDTGHDRAAISQCFEELGRCHKRGKGEGEAEGNERTAVHQVVIERAGEDDRSSEGGEPRPTLSPEDLPEQDCAEDMGNHTPQPKDLGSLTEEGDERQ